MTPVDAISLVIQEQIAELRITDYPILNLIRKDSAYQSAIKWDVNVSTDATQGSAVNADAPAASSDTVRGANLPIGIYAFRETFDLLKTDIRQARTAAPSALKNLIAAQTRSKILKIMKGHNLALYVGAGEQVRGGIYGLDTIASSTATYAGINPATAGNEAWIGHAEDTVGALTADKMDSAAEAMYTLGSNFTHIVTTPTIVTKYKKLFRDNHMTAGNVAGTADIGFTGVTYEGRPVIQDRDCPEGAMYFVDEPQLSLHTYAVDGVQTMRGLNVVIAELPSNSSLAVRFEVAVISQLQAFDRRAVAKLGDITG
ncbi:MAG TPA: phage major capsid protein [Trichocoleus sp.]